MRLLPYNTFYLIILIIIDYKDVKVILKCPTDISEHIDKPFD